MPVKDIGADELLRLIENNREGLQIIDVREIAEYEQAHIKGSKLLPIGDFFGKINEIDLAKLIVLICRSGSRSKLSARQLLKIKEVTVYNLKNGMIEIAEKMLELLERSVDKNIHR